MTANAGVDALNRARESWNAGALDKYLEIYAEDAVLHGYAGVEPGIASIEAFYQGHFRAWGPRNAHSRCQASPFFDSWTASASSAGARPTFSRCSSNWA